MYWDSGSAWIWMTVMMVMMVIFWGAVAFVVIALVRRPNHRVDRGSDACAILEARFARGELDTDEYEQRRRVLDGAAHPTAPRG